MIVIQQIESLRSALSDLIAAEDEILYRVSSLDYAHQQHPIGSPERIKSNLDYDLARLKHQAALFKAQQVLKDTAPPEPPAA